MRRRVIAAIKGEELVKDQLVATLDHEIRHGDMERLTVMRNNKRTL